MNSPVLPRTITALAFDVGILCTAAVRASFDPLRGPVGEVSFCILKRDNMKKKPFELLQDEMLEWLDGEHMKKLREGVNHVAVELHWSGPGGVSGVSAKIRILEFTIRQFYKGLGIPSRGIWASSFKRFHGACKKDYKKNKELARKVALAYVIKDAHHAKEDLMSRLHDLGDAYMLAAYVGEHNLELEK